MVITHHEINIKAIGFKNVLMLAALANWRRPLAGRRKFCNFRRHWGSYVPTPGVRPNTINENRITVEAVVSLDISGCAGVIESRPWRPECKRSLYLAIIGIWRLLVEARNWNGIIHIYQRLVMSDVLATR